jgi:hypothetical protein
LEAYGFVPLEQSGNVAFMIFQIAKEQGIPSTEMNAVGSSLKINSWLIAIGYRRFYS